MNKSNNYKPPYDWSNKKALYLFEHSNFSFPVDVIHYLDFIKYSNIIPDKSINCIIADPPFGISFTGRESVYNRKSTNVQEGYVEVEEYYDEFSQLWINELSRMLDDKGSVWIFSGWSNLSSILNAISNTNLNLINHIIWKYQFGVYTKRKFVSSHYHLLFLSKTKNYFFNKIDNYPLDVWDINRTYSPNELKNGTKLPHSLVMKCIDYSSKPGDLILDPFMGNGTTAVASKSSYRHYLGFELNKSMKKIIDNNLNQVDIGSSYLPFSLRNNNL
tara:strand:+ start:4155 stop:4976 length:822 start_codon:yes stop_codon:yes gene_type:complete